MLARNNNNKASCIEQLVKNGISRKDAVELRRISMTLHRWHEGECGNSDTYGSWVIERDGDEDDSKPFMVYRSYRGTQQTTRTPIPDRENGAKKRLKAVLARYPSYQAYIQSDPRGCALYILRPGDVPEGSDLMCCYTNGMAVYK